MDRLDPIDHAEAVALFRAQVIGALSRRELSRGELRAALVELSRTRFRPPGAKSTRTFSVPTLERWLYRYRRGGPGALSPRPRSDRGRAHALTPAQRALLLDIRREHPGASTTLILRTLAGDGRLATAAVSAATVRRLYREHGLERAVLAHSSDGRTRLRWQAEAPNALWHGDVCHGPAIDLGGTFRPLRIHALLDDASRYIVALEAHHAEREQEMLALLLGALRRHGRPAALYLDNGATYRGEVLQVACARLGVTLLHARPYDPQARGKMERFWRTLREGCLATLGTRTSLADVQVRLDTFLREHYHRAPHAALLGKSPGEVYAAGPPPDRIDEQALRAALTVRDRRRVRRDTTVAVEGAVWELDQGWLAGRVVTVARAHVDPPEPPWVEYEGKQYALRRVDPLRNARRARPPRRTPDATATPTTPVAFDPHAALLARAAARAGGTP